MYVLLLALIVPAASGLVDCRFACRSCRENKETPSMVEVYCSMCEECKEKRRAKLGIGDSPTITHLVETVITISIAPEQTVQYKELPSPTSESIHFTPTTEHILEKMRKEFATMRYPSYGRPRYDDDHYDYGRPQPLRGRPKGGKRIGYRHRGHQPKHHQYEYEDEYHAENINRQPLRSGVLDIPEGCPTPPDCSYEDYCEEPTTRLTTEETTTAAPTTTMTTTTPTTRKPCPPIKPCRKKRTTSRRPRRPCGMACLMPMCPCPVQMMCPGQKCANQATYQCPGQQCANQPTLQPSFQPNYQPAASGSNEALSVTQPSKTQSNDYYYMYVGVPKNVLKQ